MLGFKTNKLNKDYTDIGRRIVDMKVGDKGYVTPWTMAVLADLTCYIDGNTTWDSSPGGTVSLLVERTHDGFRVDAKNAYRITFGYSYEWNVRSDCRVPPGYLPVTEVLN